MQTFAPFLKDPGLTLCCHYPVNQKEETEAVGGTFKVIDFTSGFSLPLEAAPPDSLLYR